MMRKSLGVLTSLAMVLSACSGGGGSSGNTAIPGGTGGSNTPGGTVTPTPTAGCTLRERQDWVTAQMREWYLFPDTLPANPNPGAYSNVSDYLDSLTATARGQNKDRYFTYLTSIADENAYYNSGASAGFGFRLASDATGRRVFVIESYENTPALRAGIDRGAEIVAIGTSAGTMRTVGDIVSREGLDGVTNALGPSTVGTTRVLRIADATGTRDVTLAKADYAISPVSNRYGARILDNGGTKVGYINLRTFISTADPQLRDAFANFRANGVTQVIVDLRYNGGGLLSIAELMGDLMSGGRSAGDIFDYVSFRPEKSSENSSHSFQALPQSITPTRIAFIGTGSSASASELVINAFVPYLHSNAALIGTNTYGKPVGQIAIDRSACDDRLRVIAFSLQNAARVGDYYNGLANKVEASCQAVDDLGYPLGDPREASVRSALDFLAGRSCTPITASAAEAGGRSAQSTKLSFAERVLLMPTRPAPVQREAPGTF